MIKPNLKGGLGLLLCILLAGASFGQSIEFQSGSFNEVKQLAIQEQKPIFLDIYTDWCGPCKWMEKTVFSDPEVGAYMNANYLSIRVNAETQESSLIEQLGVEVYPTMVFYNSSGKLIYRQEGALEAEEFLSLVKSLANINTYYETYSKNNKRAETVYNFTTALKWQDERKATKLARTYLLELDEKKYTDSLNWELIKSFVSANDHALFPRVIAHEKIPESYPAEFTAYLQMSLAELLKESVEKPSSTLLKKYLGYLSYARQYLPNVDSLALVAKLQYANQNGDKTFVPLLIQYIDTYESKNPLILADIALQLAQDYFNTEVLDFAMKLANQSLAGASNSKALLAKALTYDKLNKSKLAYAHLLLAYEYADEEMKEILANYELKFKGKLEYALNEGVNTVVQDQGTDDGRFTLGSGTRRLMYGYPVPKSTSHFVVNVNGKLATNAAHFPSDQLTPLLGETVFAGMGGTPVVHIAFMFEGVRIIQILTPVDKDGKEITIGLAQYYRVTYEFENTDNQFKVIGLNVLFDTMIDDNDYCTIAANGRILKTETAYAGKYIPSLLLFYRTERDTSDHMGAAIIQGLEATKPDKMIIGNWPELYRVRWTFKSSNSRYGDSAYLLQWENRRLQPNGKMSFTTYYGLPRHKQPSLRILLEDNSQLTLTTSIYFQHEKAELDLNAKMKISDLLEDKSIQITGVLLNGFADITGGRDFNFELSKRRIENVGAIFKAHGIGFVPKPYGIDQSDANDYNLLFGNTWDRRVEIIMYYRKKSGRVSDLVSGL